ncbi:MAG: hypothetical protein FJZ11_00375 [Candidatus Omnitrophica bacterium]|nr:hypothetical protein [Candidatus Omnitrophota bacterium]
MWENNPEILNNSKFISWLLRIGRALRDKMVNYPRTSISIGVLNRISLYPIKTIGIVLVAAILMDIFFFNQGIGLLVWIIRALFLFIGLGAVFCDAKWQDLKESSVYYKVLLSHK